MVPTSRRPRERPALCAALLLLSSIAGPSCNAATASDAGEASAVTSEAGELSPYPRASWRLLEEKALDDVVVWSAHILIRHVESDDDVPFTRSEWHTSEPAPQRSRVQAIALARQVAARAAEHPAEFAALVAEYSEDAPTRAVGGELGGLRAADMAREQEVLDALSALHPGEVSRPVETSHGLHILLLESPPAPEVVTGRRIVIGHADADGQGRVRPRRTLAEARELARQVAESARVGTEAFDALARRSSDWHDAQGASALGSWSLRESSALGRQLAVLRKLRVGEVSAPFEGPLGVEIVQRLENPAPEPQRPDAQLGLPAFVRPGLEQLLMRVPPRVVVQELEAVVEAMGSASALDADQLQLLAEVRSRSQPLPESTSSETPRAAFAASVTAFLAIAPSSPYRAWLEDRLCARVTSARVIRYQQKLVR
ncbi:MAG TPA: peptidylprolyl isomerase [Polyangiaceae bacterium]|nr:peptidylprolyl isomerase [Polyangiaceae bacterium]